jgi:hypothetical protein
VVGRRPAILGNGERGMAKQTRIAIETDSLLVLNGRSSLRAWCPRCQAESEVISLEGVGVISNLSVPEVEAWMESEELHRSESPDGTALICLNSLLKRVQTAKTLKASSAHPRKGGNMISRILIQVTRAARRCRLASIVLLALAWFTASASAEPFVYVVTLSQQFGTIDLANGSFHAIGNPTPDIMADLVWGPDGFLYSLTTSGNDIGSLAKINPTTGKIMGKTKPTGLSYNVFSLGAVGGNLYITDLSNNIYSLNPVTGAATLIKASGVPPDPNIPFTFNNDGTFNLCDEGFYGIGGELYATFDSFAIDVNSTIPTIADLFVPPALYRIDPATGSATYVAETSPQLTALVQVNGQTYAFKGVLDGFDHTFNFPIVHNQLVTFDLATGEIKTLTDVDPSIGVVFGATPIKSR